ncbi:hypothetical protein APHAL10511_007510 [Amanita phalloides]|nr:hypothetical protein APHAL10511_007510 [Amanita phalloides]
MSDLEGTREELISLAAGALMEAETDAKADRLIFRDEWKPTPRTRNSTTQPPSPPPNAWAQGSMIHFSLFHSSPSSTSPSPSHAPAPSPPPPPSAAAGPVPPFPPKPAPQPQVQVDGAVAELIKKNNVIYDTLINHPFPKTFGDGSASLDGFRYYMIQDTKYLQTCARVKLLSVAELGNEGNIKHFGKHHESSLRYVEKSKEILISMLGVLKNIIKATWRSEKVDVSKKHYMKSSRNEDSFVVYYVILLPCVLSYWRIAERLMENPSTLKNVVYHQAWTENNYDSSSATKYIKFINANIMNSGGVDRWSDMFKEACELQIDIFNTGLQHPTPYEIILNGTYFIHSSSGKGIVLANQNVESFLQSPSGKRLSGYFPSDAGSSVVGVDKTGGNNEKWRVIVTNNGYTFKNMETGHYLGIATELAQKKGRILQAVAKPYYWWINPAQYKGSLFYQIYESGNLRYTLHAHIDVPKPVGPNYTPISAFENCKDYWQMWLFELVQLDAADPQKDVDPKEVAKKMAKLIKRYEQIMRKEFDEIEQLREERGEEIREQLKEASKNTMKVAELFERYERVLGEELEAIEQWRRELNEMKRQELLKEARKVADGDGTRKMAELFEKYERMLQEEFDNIEQLRKERNEDTGQELLASGEAIPELVRKYEGVLQENVAACGELRMLWHQMSPIYNLKRCPNSQKSIA